MGKIVEKKKKKGRPSLLDIQKRNLREQQQQNQRQTNLIPNSNSNPSFTNSSISDPSRRFTRQNPKLDEITNASDSIHAGEDDEFDSTVKQKEKKLQKIVLKVNSQISSLNSPLNFQFSSNGSDSIVEGDNSLKKRKINAIDARSAHEDSQKEEENSFVSKLTDTPLGMAMESVPTTPLPDKKLLVFILDRLQKKDTYRVFSEPVDPKELPDYHDIVENPMDFATVRKKLSSGAYANLEQFEKDVFLICSNAMIYNSSDTIYFRQARSIQELAKRDFDNLRLESDDNGSQPKIVRRGRPPTKNLKKRLGRPPLERIGFGLSSDVTLANAAGDKNIGSYDLRGGPPDSETWSAFEANDEFPASALKGVSTKFGKKQYVLDENRRNTYKQSHTLANGRSQSVLATFDGEKKQLMAVGLHMEHSFARSLARFAATLGPIPWRIASKKIERALPAGVKFGPGWVGENDTPPSLPVPVPVPGNLLPQQESLPSSSSTAPTSLDVKVERFTDRKDPSNSSGSGNCINRISAQSIVASSSSLVGTSSEPTTGSTEPTVGPASESGVSFFSRKNDGIRHNPSFQLKQGPVPNTSMNGFIGGFQNPASKIDNLVRPILPDGGVPSTVARHSKVHETVTGTNNKLVEPMSNTHLESEDTELSGCSNTIKSDCSVVDPGGEAQAGTSMGIGQSSWQKSSEQQKFDSVPPDLNVRFQSPGSPSLTQQPDLALQL